MTARVALLVGGPAHNVRVRADLLDPDDTGALHIMWRTPSDPLDDSRPGRTVGPLTYWRRDNAPDLWDYKP